MLFSILKTAKVKDCQLFTPERATHQNTLLGFALAHCRIESIPVYVLYFTRNARRHQAKIKKIEHEAREAMTRTEGQRIEREELENRLAESEVSMKLAMTAMDATRGRPSHFFYLVNNAESIHFISHWDQGPGGLCCTKGI